MLYNHFTEELLGLQGVKITNVEQEENLIIHLKMERKRYNCICCGTATDKHLSAGIPPYDKQVGKICIKSSVRRTLFYKCRKRSKFIRINNNQDI